MFTPDDFVQEGVFINREPIHVPDKHTAERNKYFPADWSLSAPTEIDPRIDNGRAPMTISEIRTIRSSNSVRLDWYRLLEEDIAGYRIYRAVLGGTFRYVKSFLNEESLTYLDADLSNPYLCIYTVRAVDINGRESIPSSVQNQTQELVNRIEAIEEKEKEDLEEKI